MTPFITRSIRWGDLRRAYCLYAPALLSGVQKPRQSLATVLYSVEGDGIVVSHRAVWTDSEGTLLNIECPCLVGLNVVSKVEIDAIREEWHEKHRRYEELRKWMVGAAVQTQTEIPDDLT